MSATTTQTRTAATVLRDYELHHSNAPNSPSGAAIDQTPGSPPWETSYRRVPPYRPIDRNRDQTQIRTYNNRIEHVFIVTMFTGVLINATAAKQWNKTFGRISDRVFRYPIGGEY